MQRKIYGMLHCHSDHSLKDSPLKISELCKGAKEYGAEAVALTDHGSCTGLIEFMNICKKMEIKGIPGVEAYVQTEYAERTHLILLAKNYEGYREISRAVTESNNHLQSVGGIQQPIMDKVILKKYFGNGNVIAMSACVSGILAAPLLCNNDLHKKLFKISKRLESCEHIDQITYDKTKRQAEELVTKINTEALELNKLKKIAEKPYTKRLKSLEVMKNLYAEQQERYLIEKNAIEKEMEESSNAAASLVEAKKMLKADRSSLTRIRKRLKEFDIKNDEYQKLLDEYHRLESSLQSEEEKIANTEKELDFLLSIFKDDFYIELQNHGLKDEEYVMPILAGLASKKNIPVVATNDVHILNKEDAESRQFMKALRFGKWEDATETDKELYMKTDLELYESICKIVPIEIAKKAMRNIEVICNKCQVEFPDEKHYPRYRDDNGEVVIDAAGELRKQTYRGISLRYHSEEFTEEHKNRMEYELGVIINLGYADYLLIVADYINYAKKVSKDNNKYGIGYGVGPGRGSGAGCLVNYLLGITNIDPLKYGLIFERFLNKERVSMPDIDTDFSEEVRSATIEYVKRKYGAESVAIIRTVDTQSAKDVTRNSARILGFEKFPGNPDKEPDVKEGRKRLSIIADKMCKAIPATPGIKLRDCEEELNKLIVDDDGRIILDRAKKVEGTITGLGSHAAGVIIGDGEPLSNFVPLLFNTNMNQWSVQCNMVEAEQIGLLKMDFLGLNNLDIISECLRQIREDYGISIDIDHLEFEPEVFKEIFSKGKTSCVFQFESPGMKRMLRDCKPDSIEDIIALVALYRPGPMDFIPKFIEGKRNPQSIKYDCPQLKPILSGTYGCIVYQEQVMQIVRDLAGYSMGRSDILRRAMSKKKSAVMEQERQNFIYGNIEEQIPGCVSNGIDEEIANKIYDDMIDFAKYAFNKSHAAVYAIVSYQTAWLKYHYPVEYMCSILNHSDKKKLPSLLYECKELGIKIISPDINKSQRVFSTTNDGCIVYGLRSIKGVDKHAEHIINVRNEYGYFNSFLDFLTRAHENKGVTEKLIKAGVFDRCDDLDRTNLLSTLEDRLSILKNLYKKINIVKKMETELDECEDKKTRDTIKKRLVNAKNSVERAKLKLNSSVSGNLVVEDKLERLQDEYELLGAYISDHPLNMYTNLYQDERICKIIDFECDSNLTFAGMIKDIRMAKRKSDGADMAFFTLEDLTGELKVNCFTKAYSDYNDLIKEGKIVKIQGRTSIENSFANDEETENILTVRAVKPCYLKKHNLFVSVKNRTIYESLVLKKLQFFSDDNGHPFYLHFADTGDIIVPDFSLNADILNTEISGVTILP